MGEKSGEKKRRGKGKWKGGGRDDRKWRRGTK